MHKGLYWNGKKHFFHGTSEFLKSTYFTIRWYFGGNEIVEIGKSGKFISLPRNGFYEYRVKLILLAKDLRIYYRSRKIRKRLRLINKILKKF